MEKFRATLKRYAMLHRGDRVLVGVSGGADSLALLYSLHALKEELSLSLRVAHLNHRLRPESDREASFVREIAFSLGLACSLGTEDVLCYQRERKLSLEMAARELRYRFFEREADRHACSKIALGHTADDQAETVLMRLLRGTGPKGLAGIPPVRQGCYIRPLIEVSRREVEAFLAARGQTYIQDPSNASLKHWRNKVRLELLPLLQREYNPRIVEALTGLADVLRQEEAFLENHCQELLADLVREEGDGTLELDLAGLRDAPLALRRRILRLGMQNVKGDLQAISRRQIEATLDLLEGERTGRCGHFSGVVVRRERQGLLLCRARSQEPQRTPETPLHEKLLVPGFRAVPTLGLSFRTELKGREPGDLDRNRPNPWTALLDARKVSGPLSIRTRATGDRFHPLGAAGRQKLKQFFIDHRVPRPERDRVPLIVCGDEIIWVVGMRISERAKVTEDTQEVLEVVASQVIPGSPGR